MEFQCSLCNYQSKVKSSIRRHINKQIKCSNGDAEILEIPVEINCDFCQKTFTTEPSMKRHIKTCKVKITEELQNELEEAKAKQIPIIESIDNFLYILQEREFILTRQNVYKLGITKTVRNRMTSYPKGSKIYCVLPVEGDPETKCLHKFRELFTSRVDIGSEYFEGNINDMINTLYENLMSN